MDSPGAVMCIDYISIGASKWIGSNKPSGGYMILKLGFRNDLEIIFDLKVKIPILRFSLPSPNNW